MRIDLNGIAINYEDEGSGTPLVLTHGLGDDLHFWDAVTPGLAAHHRVIRWDIRGFGQSDKPPGPYSPALLAADLAALFDHLEIDAAHVLLEVAPGTVVKMARRAVAARLPGPDTTRSTDARHADGSEG